MAQRKKPIRPQSLLATQSISNGTTKRAIRSSCLTNDSTTVDLVLRELNWASSRWWKSVVGAGGWNQSEQSDNASRILAACRPFGGSHELSADCANAIVAGVHKGKHLVQAALEWQSPHVGGNGSRTDQLRGAQWRLVIGWSGLETIIVSLQNSPKLRRHHLAVFLKACGLPDYQALDPPKRSRSRLEPWLTAVEAGAKHPMQQYLGLTGAEVLESVQRWLIDGQPVESWVESMILAKSLRHTSAHGALSATKIHEWGLHRAFTRLLLDIGVVTAHTLHQLSSQHQA